MDEEKIRLSFLKAKQDIQELRDQLSQLFQEITDIKELVLSQNSRVQQTIQQTNKPTDIQIQQNQPFQHINQEINQQINEENPSIQQEISTNRLNEPEQQPQYSLKSPFSVLSTGNRGVPTNRQTNRQSNQQTDSQDSMDDKTQFDNIPELINSLDALKQEVRIKFKKLTEQEMLVFSTIYQLQEQGSLVDYPLLAQIMKLSESSIRDYTHKIIKKGIPLEKYKENNKKVFLKVSENLKKIASLSTITRLREI